MRNLIKSSVLAMTALVITAPAFAQLTVDDLRVRQLESEVQRLQREVDAQSRRIEVLEQAARLAAPAPGVAAPLLNQDSSPAWLVPASWDRIKRGMASFEVIAILGRPTSARDAQDGKGRVFYYAMELGPNQLLAGNIRLDDSGVVEINRPALK